MKKTLLVTAALLFGATAIAQSGSGFGLKGGLNYAGNGDYFDSASNAFENPDRNAGFHFGFWGKVGNRIYIRPELVYTNTTSSYDSGDLKIQKLDLPILLGAKVIGPLHLFAGPSFQFLLNEDFDGSGLTLGEVESGTTVGLNIGAGVNLGKLGVDLRYERGFTENEINVINANVTNINDRVDTRPDQLILSLSLKI